MAQGIVDVFKAIQIQKKDGDIFFLAMSQGNRLRNPVVEHQAIGQIGRQSCWAECAIWRERLRVAVTSWNTITAPVTRPARSRIGAAESSIANSNPSRRMRIQFAGRTTEPFCGTAISMGSTRALRVAR